MGLEESNDMEEELGSLDEEFMGFEQDEQQEDQKPTALEPEACRSGGPEAYRSGAAIFPVVEPECKTPEKRSRASSTIGARSGARSLRLWSARSLPLWRARSLLPWSCNSPRGGA